MNRKEIVAKKRQFIYPAVANYFTDPLPFERGEMQYLWDVEGKAPLPRFSLAASSPSALDHANPPHHRPAEGPDRQARPHLHAFPYSA